MERRRPGADRQRRRLRGRARDGDAHQNLLDSVALIDSLAQAQGAVTTGITVDKKVFQDQMVSYALRVAGALMAYASTNNTTRS
ncbi:MAG: hypothetical protein H0W66_01375 [Chthoniobacterales bacterium]|nr:hypothetical protein [Chthoniobacterales bacterium]